MPDRPIKLADITPAMRFEYDEVEIRGVGETFFVSHRIGMKVPSGLDRRLAWKVLVVEVESDPRDVTTQNEVRRRLGLQGF